MFSIIEAILGGAYYGARVGYDKHKQNQATQKLDTALNSYKNSRGSFESRATNLDVENNISRQLRDAAYDDEVFNRIKEELQQAYSEMPWRGPDYPIYKRLLGDEALRILLANRGLVMYTDAACGIEMSWRYQPTEQERNRLAREQADFVLWINSKLREHGIHADVVIEVGSCPPYQNWYTVEIGWKERLGVYKWKPTIFNIGPVIGE